MRGGKLEYSDLRDLNILKHYRVVRKWAAKNNDISTSDLEILIYLDCVGLFNRLDFIDGMYSHSWDSRRWSRLMDGGWLTVFSKRDRVNTKKNIYKVSFKGKSLINRVYKIMVGEEDIPTSTRRNSIMKGDTYTDKVLIKSIKEVNKDKTINNGI
mgnify:CR=1 FL=1|tara:strand:- start:262 stop:726 length:465 start_codon:yes stop_codon:yes gene_type:complete